MNNSLTLVGHVGQNPIVKTFSDTGNKLAKFSIAVREYSSNRDEQKTMWVDVDAWNGLADRVIATITKGREVVINGRLAMASFEDEKDGIARMVTKPVVKLTGFHLCGPKPEDKDEESKRGSYSSNTRRLEAVRR